MTPEHLRSDTTPKTKMDRLSRVCESSRGGSNFGGWRGDSRPLSWLPRLSVVLLLAAGFIAVFPRTSQAATSDTVDTSPVPQQVGLDGYQQHLAKLRQMIKECELAVTPENCRAERVGPDDQVSTSSGQRNVEYGWLRNNLRLAASARSAKEPQKALEQATKTLQDADQRLQQESVLPTDTAQPKGDLGKTRGTLSAILSESEFARVAQPGLFEKLRDILLEWLSNQLQRVGRSGWSSLMTNLLLLSAITIVCAALVWWFTRQIFRQGITLPSSGLGHEGTPSARSWQAWLEEAHLDAQKGQWREAIHDVYWGAISRLEASGMWPADRARTPREYLNLLAANTERRVDLTLLTRSFERTWYGGRVALKQDFEDACRLLDQLGSR
jgi:hypothetical protein